MLPYWFLFALFALGSLLGVPRSVVHAGVSERGNFQPIQHPRTGTPVFSPQA